MNETRISTREPAIVSRGEREGTVVRAYAFTVRAYAPTVRAYASTGRVYAFTGRAYASTGRAYALTGRAYASTGRAYGRASGAGVYTSSIMLPEHIIQSLLIKNNNCHEA
jgi:hypothetical protein